MFNLSKVVINFVFLQVSGPLPWYWLLHNSNDFENNMDCVQTLISSPVGNKSVITVNVYVKRWVHNIQSMFMQFVTKNRYGL